jgi:hypothetical protein
MSLRVTPALRNFGSALCRDQRRRRAVMMMSSGSSVMNWEVEAAAGESMAPSMSLTMRESSPILPSSPMMPSFSRSGASFISFLSL